MSDLCLTLMKGKARGRFKYTKKSRPHFLRVHEYRVWKKWLLTQGFWVLLTNSTVTLINIPKAKQEGFLRIDLNRVWESLSFAAQNVSTSLLFLCSEYSRRKPAVVWRGPEHVPVSSCSQEGTQGVLQAAICYCSPTPLRQANLKEMLKVINHYYPGP